jgi:hypothetical protein
MNEQLRADLQRHQAQRRPFTGDDGEQESLGLALLDSHPSAVDKEGTE